MTTTKNGNRQRLPEDALSPRLRIKLPPNALKVCAACGTPRGNTQRGWTPIIDSECTVRGYTCSACPEYGLPIYRATTKAGAVRWRTVMVEVRDGKQKWRTFETLDEARAHVAKVRTALAAGEIVATGDESVEQLVARWLRGLEVRDVTKEGYYYALRPVVRRLGTKRVGNLRLHHVRDLTEWMKREGSAKGAPLGKPGQRAALVAFAQVLDIAVAEKVLAENYVRDRTVKKPSVKTKAGFANLQHWPVDSDKVPREMFRFREVSDRHPYAALWRLTLLGLTRADICGLRWSDIDFDAGTVTISQGRVSLQAPQFIEANGGSRSATEAPKSAQRWRVVAPDSLHEGTMTMLRALKARQAADRLAAGRAYDASHDLVLVDGLGGPLRPEVWSDWFRRLCVEAEDVRTIHLHSVRHSLAAWMDALGVPIAARAALLGHTVQVHMSTYLPSATAAGINDALSAMGATLRQRGAAGE